MHGYPLGKDDSFRLNDTKSNPENVEIKTDIDALLAYFDVKYGQFPLAKREKYSKKTYQTLLEELHGTLIQRHSSQSYTFSSVPALLSSDPWKLKPSQQTQLEGYSKFGATHLLRFLDNLYGEGATTPTRIKQRFGATVEQGKLYEREFLLVDGSENQKVYAPMKGKIQRFGNRLCLKQGKKEVCLQGIKDSPFPQAEEISIDKHQFIGFVDNANGIRLTYAKAGHVLNPAFFLGPVQYLESTNYGFELGGFTGDLERLKLLIQLQGGAFANEADTILEISKQAGVSPFLFVAILACESGWGTSRAIREHQNPSGQMVGGKLLHFNSLREGLEATARTLHNLVLERGLQTVEALGSAYAPVGASNDPLGLNQHWVPNIKRLIVHLGGDSNGSLLWEESFGGIGGKVLTWAKNQYQKGVIYTQDGRRGSFPYFDCSAFVTTAMSQAGVPYAHLCSTETLFQWESEGKLQRISRTEVHPGDLFVWGTRGASGGNAGHTGIFTDNGKTILHCTSSVSQNGNVVLTPFEGFYGDPGRGEVVFLRVK